MDTRQKQQLHTIREDKERCEYFPFLLLKKVYQLFLLSKYSKIWPYLSSLKFPAPFDCWQMSNQHLLTVLQIQVYPKKYSKWWQQTDIQHILISSPVIQILSFFCTGADSLKFIFV